MTGILAACLLTIAVETPILYGFGMRRGAEVGLVAAANAATNLGMNLFLLCGIPGTLPWLLFLETAVIWLEYRCFARAAGSSKKLFFGTVVSNLASVAVGLAVMEPLLAALHGIF